MPAYSEMTEEQRKAFTRSVTKYQNKRYIHDDDYRQKKRDNSARYYKKHADDPMAKLKGGIHHFVYYINLRHDAGKPVEPNVKFTEYNVIYDMTTNRYTSLRLKDILATDLNVKKATG
jgi:hypothetical protein